MSKDRFRPAQPGAIGDHAISITFSEPTSLGDGFRPYQRFALELEGPNETPLRQTRDIIRVGPVIAVLAYDPAAEMFVLIRQFRLAAHLATGKGEVTEIAAGLIEPGEDAHAAALRETREEIGVSPHALLPMFTFMPSPGVSDEFATVFLALVDSTQVPDEAGEPGETEFTRPFLLPLTDAMEALTVPFPGVACNSFVLASLQWFALNRAKVDRFVAQQR